MKFLLNPCIKWQVFSFLILFSYTEKCLADDKLDSLFKSDEIFKIELKIDFSSLLEDRTEDPEDHKGELIYYSSSGEPTVLSVKVKPRGNFRRQPVNCKFPPLQINFDKDEVPGTLFENQNKIKLVTPCQLEEDVFEEYVIYKMYNEVTSYSLRVRMAEISYYDTEKDIKLFEKHSFFIEDIDHLAKRMNGKEIDRHITPFELNPDLLKRLEVFQFLIGNKDWYITTRHNINLIQPEDTTVLPVAVPYDFDFSGFVNAGYTKPKGVPDEMLENRRIYKGLCYSDEEFYAVFSVFRSLKPSFESMIMEEDLISKFSRKQDIRYIQEFYRIINDKTLYEKEFLKNCMTRKDYFKFEK